MLEARLNQAQEPGYRWRWALGAGRWALGAGRWALGSQNSSVIKFIHQTFNTLAHLKYFHHSNGFLRNNFIIKITILS
jgi:hypothetical protein